MTAPLVLLDLDGTLSDSAPGIIRSARAALGTLGLPVPPAEALLAFVGPPLPISLAMHGVPEERILDGIDAYRAAFEAGGMWESAPFVGIPEQLERLRAAGVTVAVATSKPEVYARQICERWGLDVLVDGVYGAPADHVPSTKATVIAHAFEELGPQRVPDTAQIVMVGDRHHDVDGAAANGIDCLGVAWGYGEPGELRDAVGVIPAVEDLASTVLDFLAESAQQDFTAHSTRSRRGRLALRTRVESAVKSDLLGDRG